MNKKYLRLVTNIIVICSLVGCGTSNEHKELTSSSSKNNQNEPRHQKIIDKWSGENYETKKIGIDKIKRQVTNHNPWQMKYVNSARTGIIETKGINERPLLKWGLVEGGEVSYSPSVSNGVVYTGTNKGYVFALHSKTGARIWEKKFNGSITSTPTTQQSTVFIGSSKNKLLALDTKSGKKKWSAQTQGSIYSPAISQNYVVVTTTSGHASAYDLNTGQQEWTSNLNSYSLNPPMIAGKTVYITGAKGVIRAIDIQTGEIIATSQDYPNTKDFTIPVFYNDFIAFGANYSHSMADEGQISGFKSGEFFSLGSPKAITESTMHKPLILSEKIYSTNDKGRILKFSYRTGYSEIFGQSNFAMGDVNNPELTYVNEVIYTVSGDSSKVINAYNLGADNQKKIKWSFRIYSHLSEKFESTPVIVDGMIYMVTSDGNLYAFTSNSEIL